MQSVILRSTTKRSMRETSWVSVMQGIIAVGTDMQNTAKEMLAATGR